MSNEQNTDTHRHMLSQCLVGLAPLWQAFWLVGVTGHVLVAAATELLLAFVPRTILSQSAMIWSGTAWLTYLGYAVFSSLCIWRCAHNTGLPAWTFLSRVVVTLNVSFVGFGVLALVATGGS